jgi:hypothetical protein
MKKIEDAIINIANTKKPNKVRPQIDIISKFNIEFIEDFRGFKKGAVLKGISEVAKEFYILNKVAKELK